MYNAAKESTHYAVFLRNRKKKNYKLNRAELYITTRTPTMVWSSV